MSFDEKFRVLRIIARNLIALGLVGGALYMAINSIKPPGEFWSALVMVLAFYFKSEDG